MATALDIGVLSGRLSFSDFVGSSDRDDFYRFTLANTSNNFNISLTGLSDSAKVELIYDSNGNGQFDNYDSIIDYDYGSISYNPSISSPLGQATYFVRVRTYSSDDNTRYSLWLSA